MFRSRYIRVLNVFRLIWPRSYLHEDVDMYSIKDLVKLFILFKLKVAGSDKHASLSQFSVVLITAIKNVMALTSELLFEACFEKSFIVLVPHP
jgi:hypothetical protein